MRASYKYNNNNNKVVAQGQQIRSQVERDSDNRGSPVLWDIIAFELVRFFFYIKSGFVLYIL